MNSLLDTKERQKILDSRGSVICDLTEWEKIQTINEPQERYKATGVEIAKLLNEMDEEKEKERDEKIVRLTIPTPSFQRMALFEWD